jgi:hypothetical protein
VDDLVALVLKDFKKIVISARAIFREAQP